MVSIVILISFDNNDNICHSPPSLKLFRQWKCADSYWKSDHETDLLLNHDESREYREDFKQFEGEVNQ